MVVVIAIPICVTEIVTVTVTSKSIRNTNSGEKKST